MNADFLVGKLMIVEENPFKIWESLESSYGSGYFNIVIEKVMGVTADFKKKLYDDFRAKIAHTTLENERLVT